MASVEKATYKNYQQKRQYYFKNKNRSESPEELWQILQDGSIKRDVVGLRFVCFFQGESEPEIQTAKVAQNFY